ncbi:hypothetical protein [Gordonia sp. UCD-TK1]|nr:hypothetical protein [Gordonia sp. UCD-TK1]
MSETFDEGTVDLPAALGLMLRMYGTIDADEVARIRALEARVDDA